MTDPVEPGGLDEPDGPDGPVADEEPVDVWALGGPVLLVDLVGTVALGLVSLLTAIWSANVTQIATLVVAVVLFVGGCGAFAVGFVRVADRSRREVVDLAGVFYLTRSAPRPVRRAFLGLWYAQIAIAVASVAFVRPPFGVMAPVWGIGLITLWASRHATFPVRDLRGSR